MSEQGVARKSPEPVGIIRRSPRLALYGLVFTTVFFFTIAWWGFLVWAAVASFRWILNGLS